MRCEPHRVGLQLPRKACDCQLRAEPLEPAPEVLLLTFAGAEFDLLDPAPDDAPARMIPCGRDPPLFRAVLAGLDAGAARADNALSSVRVSSTIAGSVAATTEAVATDARLREAASPLAAASARLSCVMRALSWSASRPAILSPFLRKASRA